MITALHWMLVAASLGGMVLNIKHRRECFIVWSVTNASWVAVDISHGLLSQASLQAVYFGFSVWSPMLQFFLNQLF